ncbi:MAG: hypothetical protein CMJ20_06765 [Phycisphaeraceae bacterium]|nr:hypothetical protein [Phycisphaeraceae bacterium]
MAAKKQMTKVRIAGLAKTARSLLEDADCDLATFKHEIRWIELYRSLIESIDRFVDFLSMDAGRLDDEDRLMLEQLESILGVLKK